MKKIMVISLGGSLIVPDKVDFQYLDNFKATLKKHYKTHKFVVVCGGGSIARKYINALKKEGRSHRQLSIAGIRATRMNAKFMMQFFGKEANDTLPISMKSVKSNLSRNNIVFCGALYYDVNSTTDGNAAKLARYLKSDFINLTNVPGLYTSNPKKNKNAKLIPKISWTAFEKKANKLKFKAGQHFVLDQRAASIIRKHKIKTYIIGPDTNQISNLLKGKKFKGTSISG